MFSYWDTWVARGGGRGGQGEKKEVSWKPALCSCYAQRENIIAEIFYIIIDIQIHGAVCPVGFVPPASKNASLYSAISFSACAS